MTVLLVMGHTAISFSQFIPGQTAPVFSMKDTLGRPHDLSGMTERPMIILYFFDVESRASQEGLLSLDQLAKQYKETDLIVWGITLSPMDKVTEFMNQTELIFPVMIDKEDVSDSYQARIILPTVYILGPELKVLDYFQGGGKTTEVMLVKVAERELQQNHTMMAKAIGREVEKRNPQNLKAKTIQGYAALKEGNLVEAEKNFQDVSEKPTGKIVGKEGLAAVYAQKGEIGKALKAAKEVEQAAPERGYVHKVKGDIYYSQGKMAEAGDEYQKSVEKQETEDFQRAEAYNKYGRFQASLENFEIARGLYDLAVDINPYYIEATSNKGMTYEKEGKWEKAIESYNKALAINRDDTFAAVLAKNSLEMLSLQKNTARKERVDKLVKELAARFRSQKSIFPKFKDTWTSRPMILSFVDLQEKGGLAERDGLSSVLIAGLTDKLNASGRVRVVERVLIERLLEELNLGSSKLADPETALRLGKVLAAKLIGTGSLFYLPDMTLLSLRLIDTETSAIPKVINRQFGSRVPLEKDLNQLDREILRTIIRKYPLRGYVIQITGEQVMINLGTTQGMVLGTKFEVIEEGKPIKYKKKILRGIAKVIGEIVIEETGLDTSFGKILHSDRPLKRDDKIQEKLEDLLSMGGVYAGS
jgi:tetratricopeptide (TPR) repeat protein